jgi:protein NrfD
MNFQDTKGGTTMNVVKIFGFGILVLALLFGGYGVMERLETGHELAAYGSYVPWGLWVALYIYFIGLSAGSFLVSTLVYAFGVRQLEKIGKLSLWTALVTLMAALLVIWLDLGHMERFWRIFVSPNPFSMMAWMVWLYTGYIVLLAIEFWVAIRADVAVSYFGRDGSHKFSPIGALIFGIRSVDSLDAVDSLDEPRMRDREILRALAGLGVVLAVFFHGGVGALFGSIIAQPFWNSGLFPIMFLVSALLSGSALLAFLVAVFFPEKQSEDYRKIIAFLGAMILGLLAFDVLLEWSEASIALYGGVPHHADPWRAVLFGPFWWVFWMFHVVLGVVIPAILLMYRATRPWLVGIASLLIAASFFAVRLNIVIPALATPQLQRLGEAYQDARLSFVYFPSVMEWRVGLFVAGLAVVMFLLGRRYIPIFENRPSKHDRKEASF